MSDQRDVEICRLQEECRCLRADKAELLAALKLARSWMPTRSWMPINPIEDVPDCAIVDAVIAKAESK